MIVCVCLCGWVSTFAINKFNLLFIFFLLTFEKLAAKRKCVELYKSRTTTSSKSDFVCLGREKLRLNLMYNFCNGQNSKDTSPTIYRHERTKILSIITIYMYLQQYACIALQAIFVIYNILCYAYICICHVCQSTCLMK